MIYKQNSLYHWWKPWECREAAFADLSKCVFGLRENANTADERQSKGRRGAAGPISLIWAACRTRDESAQIFCWDGELQGRQSRWSTTQGFKTTGTFWVWSLDISEPTLQYVIWPLSAASPNYCLLHLFFMLHSVFSIVFLLPLQPKMDKQQKGHNLSPPRLPRTTLPLCFDSTTKWTWAGNACSQSSTHKLSG